MKSNKEQERYKLKKKIKSLENMRGRHTELITLYVPGGYDINKTISKLSEEQGTAQNIKSKSTRKNVITALEKIIRELKLFKKTPKNGLAIFCGNVADQEGETDFILETIVPPNPLNISLYRCSQEFILDPLKEMMDRRETYGLIVIDRRNADIALLKGKSIQTLASLDSMVPGKFRAGGQSAQRFERVIEGMAKDFYKKAGEVANREFKKIKELKGILVGGPGPTKDEFLAEEYLHTNLQNKIIGTLDIGYTGETGLEELVNKSKDILSEAEVTKEKQLVKKFMRQLSKDTGLGGYGEEEIRDAIRKGAVELLLLSEKLDKKRIVLKCTNCDHIEERTAKEVPELTCDQCGSAMELESEKDLIEDLAEKAEGIGAQVELISDETKEGKQLWGMGGIAAVLRFKVHS